MNPLKVPFPDREALRSVTQPAEVKRLEEEGWCADVRSLGRRSCVVGPGGAEGVTDSDELWDAATRHMRRMHVASFVCIYNFDFLH